MIILALVAMNLTDVEAKKFYHYGNTLTFLCDDETMTAEVAGTYHVETSGTITVPETFVAILIPLPPSATTSCISMDMFIHRAAVRWFCPKPSRELATVLSAKQKSKASTCPRDWSR